MSEEALTMNEYTKSAQYKQLLVATTFDKKGHVFQVTVEEAPEPAPSTAAITAIIDHTLLKPDTSEEQMVKFCQEAKDYHFGAVCVNSCWVSFCVKQLEGTSVKVGSTVGFPWGTPSTESKVIETRQAIKAGAREVDMVLNIGKLKSWDYQYVANDIHEVVRAAHKHDVLVKVILETCLLTEEEKVIACLIAKQAGVDFVKTSTGFAGPGATVEDVALMRSVVGLDMGVKAAGGVRTYEDVKKMIAAGATRIGTSAGIRIAQEAAGEYTSQPQTPDAY
ncbi:MAG: deoxyribose-phosphate aldolase [Anaerolineaceae bacterium]